MMSVVEFVLMHHESFRLFSSTAETLIIGIFSVKFFLCAMLSFCMLDLELFVWRLGV